MSWDIDCLMEIELKEIRIRLWLVDPSYAENRTENDDHRFIQSKVDFWMISMSRLKLVHVDENELGSNSTGLLKSKKARKCLKKENGKHRDGQNVLHNEELDPTWVVYHFTPTQPQNLDPNLDQI